MDDGAEMRLKSTEKEEVSKGGRWRLGHGDVGLSFSSSVWILVLLLGAGAPLACPGLRYLKYRQTGLVADTSTVLSYIACIRLVLRVGTAPVGVPESLDTYLPPWGVPWYQSWEPQSQIQTAHRGSAPLRGRMSREWCSRAYGGADRNGTVVTTSSVQRK